MGERHDVVVVGAGHNGLICAAYLARAGRRVLVVEAAGEVGGATATGEIAPGFKISTYAHLTRGIVAPVMNDLDLEGHGLAYSATAMPTMALDSDGRHLWVLDPGNGAENGTSDEALLTTVAQHSAADATALAAFRTEVQCFSELIRPLLTTVPPRLGTRDRSNRAQLLRLGWGLRRIGREAMRELLRVAPMNIADWLEERFESDLLRGGIAFDAVVGAHLGPRSPTSVLTYLWRLAGDSGLGLRHPRGGMGSVSGALAAAARSAGVEIRTGAPVSGVWMDGDRAAGVRLGTGEKIPAACVVSSCDPKRTFLELVGPRHLDTQFVRRVRSIRMRGNVAKLNLALDGLPAFTGVGGSDMGARFLIAPGIGHLERAFDCAKYGHYSEAPAIELIVPSVHDPSLAPEGKHVLSALVLYAPYELRDGWDTARERFTDQVIETIRRYAPDLPSRIVARQLLTPADLSRDLGLTGGHWHHGEIAFDQLLMLRPVPGAAQYATPVPGLYLCGAGTHPGGGVTGAAGLNAARRINESEPGS